MPQLLTNLQLIWEDIKHSWYFRVWAFFWLFSAIFTFAVLILLGQTSTQAQLEPTFKFWRENVSSITFPRFHFFTGENPFVAGSLACKNQNTPLQIVTCAPRHDGKVVDTSHCLAVAAENTVANNQNQEWRQRIIHCSFQTTPAVPNEFVSFEIEGEGAHFGYFSHELLIAPNNNSWVLLDKGYITFNNGRTVEEWGREIVYHSSYAAEGSFEVSVIIDRFLVTHGEQGMKFDGWRALGEIGGFAYFLLLLHAFMMILVGICLNNDAKTLTSDSPASGYAALGSNEERTGML